MRFRLTYQGPLPSSQREPFGNQRDARAQVKRHIRSAFHRQLRRLWATNKNLNGAPSNGYLLVESSPSPPLNSIEELSAAYQMYEWNFVPLVTERHHLTCSLDILFLRPDDPGQIVWAGDIDNRIKTLFDALKLPDANEGYDAVAPSDDERPFFCLLEDDKLITRIAVETDQMLEPVGPSLDVHDVRLVINVELRPYFTGVSNRHFG